MSKKPVPYAAYEKRGQMIELLEGDVERLTAERNAAEIIANKLHARVEALEGAARKTLKEQDEADEHHSAACMNWALLEHSQHQCGMCDLREALEATEQGESDE